MIYKLQIVWILCVLFLPIIDSLDDNISSDSLDYILLLAISCFIGLFTGHLIMKTGGLSVKVEKLRKKCALGTTSINSYKHCILFNDKLVVTLSIAGTTLLLYFVLQNVTQYSIESLGLFSELYRNSHYKGSGIYTGISIYLMPPLIAGRLMFGIRNKSTLIGAFCVLIASIVLGLRFFIVIPFFAFLIYELIIFENQSFYHSDHMLTHDRNVNKRYLILAGFILATLIAFVFTKFIISSGLESIGYSTDFSPVKVVKDMFVRIPYTEWLAAKPTISINLSNPMCLIATFVTFSGELCANHEYSLSYVRESILFQVFGSIKGLYSGLPIPFTLLTYFFDRGLFLFLNMIVVSVVIPFLTVKMFDPNPIVSWLCRVVFIELILISLEDLFGGIDRMFMTIIFIVAPAFMFQAFQRMIKSQI
ncbi:hypothetical protein U9R62_10785 [Cylindrospermopsis raciborskii DSH]|uniref:hypothetical protein n=1 Tax=Cylindrospermopsis raciborskii TaxID=77022 RepID=UPI001BA4EA14|nr:hypothetical protein [Cylindrospermopsis raciborskii]